MSSRDAFRAAIGIASDADDQPTEIEREALARNWRLNRGAQLAPRSYVAIEGSLPGPCDGRGWTWQPHPVHAYFVERFLSQAQARQIPVYWVLPPAEAAWLDRNRRVGTVGAYRRYVRSQLARFPALTVLDMQHAGWDRAWFRDPVHLNRDGAVRLSMAVADAIAQPGSLARPGTLDRAGRGRHGACAALPGPAGRPRSIARGRESRREPGHHAGGTEAMNDRNRRHAGTPAQTTPPSRPHPRRTVPAGREVTDRHQHRPSRRRRTPSLPARRSRPSTSSAPACTGHARPGNTRSSPTCWNSTVTAGASATSPPSSTPGRVAPTHPERTLAMSRPTAGASSSRTRAIAVSPGRSPTGGPSRSMPIATSATWSSR